VNYVRLFRLGTLPSLHQPVSFGAAFFGGESRWSIGGSAGAGTAIGALAGGKKGAGVGAAAGGVGGLIYDLMTRDKK